MTDPPRAPGRLRWAALAAVVVALVVVALTVPLPGATEVRDRVAALGPWAPLMFLLVHALVTVAPFPRTAFSISAGVLFGPWLGLALCLVASTVSAAAAFALVRRVGGRAVQRLGPGRVRVLEARLSSRGFLTVLSTRLVPVLPFAPLNYTLGVSTVRWRHYVGGTALGLVPGTAAAVLLGEAATGGLSPAALAVLLVSGATGLAGVLLCARPTADEV